MFFEVDDELARRDLPAPDLVVFQAGVGAFTAAGIRHYRRTDWPHPPGTVVVGPLSANCLMASAQAGHVVQVPGQHPSVMADLNCGIPSRVAWPVIRLGVDAYISIGEDAACSAMRALADEGIVADESGAASLAGMLALANSANGRAKSNLGLRPGSCVLLVNTEGATDRERYTRIVGRSPKAVAGQKAALREGFAASQASYQPHNWKGGPVPKISTERVSPYGRRSPAIASAASLAAATGIGSP